MKLQKDDSPIEEFQKNKESAEGSKYTTCPQLKHSEMKRNQNPRKIESSTQNIYEGTELSGLAQYVLPGFCAIKIQPANQLTVLPDATQSQ